MGVKLREKKRKDQSSSLYLDIYHQGKRKYEFLNIHISNKRKFREEDKEKRELAEKLKIKRENELLNQETISFNKNKPNDNFYKHYEEFVKEKKSKYTHWKPILQYIKEFSKTKDFLAFSDINEDWLLKFQEYLLKDLANNTCLKYMIILGSVLDGAKSSGIINSNPYKSINKVNKLSQNKETDRVYLTIEELEKLSKLKVNNEHIKYINIFLFSCFTGLRWSDAHLLKWSDIRNIKNDKKTVKVLTFKQKKTGGQEYIPLSKQAVSILNDIEFQNKKTVYVFDEIVAETKKEHKISALNRINRILKEWAKKAEIKKNIHFHVARHTFATMSLTYGIDIYTVSKLLGHKSIEMTTVYAKVIDKKKNEAVAKMPKLTMKL